MVEAIASVSDSLARLASLPGPMSAPEGPDVAEVPRIDVIRLQDDDDDGSADTGGERKSVDDDPHSVTHWVDGRTQRGTERSGP